MEIVRAVSRSVFTKELNEMKTQWDAITKMKY